MLMPPMWAVCYIACPWFSLSLGVNTMHVPVSILALGATLSGLAANAVAQATPFQIAASRPVYQAGDNLALSITGAPGTTGALLADVSPGPTFVPGIGTFQLGFTPLLGTLLIPALPPSGLAVVCPTPCVPSGGEVSIYTQALSVSLIAPNFAISNPLTIRIQDPAGYCEPPVCTGSGSIGSNFNGTRIDGGNYIWFNSVGKLTNMNGPGTVRIRNARVEFESNGVPYWVQLPDTTIIVSPLFTEPSIFFEAGGNEWRVKAPEGFSGNLFLGGGAFRVPAAGLPGGTNPVSWSFDVVSNVGPSIQWKWAAAVYTQFTTDYNTLGVAPADASGTHAGVPAAFRDFVVGGARGGGGSNFTGSYSGTSTVVCR